MQTHRASVAGVLARLVGASERVGPWWSKTTWGRRKDALTITVVLVVLAFCLWKSL